jgi:hypothetical protein
MVSRAAITPDVRIERDAIEEVYYTTTPNGFTTQASYEAYWKLVHDPPPSPRPGTTRT